MSYETKTLSSGVVIENKPNELQKYCWHIKGTWIIHNEGEPAFENKDGAKYWYQHGKCHRLDGAACEHEFIELYYIDGLSYSKTNYWKHPDVLACQYIKIHPELANFI